MRSFSRTRTAAGWVRLWFLGPLWLGCLCLCAGCMPLSPAGYVTRHAAALDIPLQADAPVQQFEVQSGQTAWDIARALERAHIIGDSRLFASYVVVQGWDTRLEAGSYQFSASMTIPELALALQHGLGFGPRLTVREGLRLEETAAQLELSGLGSSARYLELTRNASALDQWRQQFSFLPSAALLLSLEGYLYPATYLLPQEHDRARQLVTLQLQEFEAQLVPLFRQGGNAADLSLHEVVTLASIVQREAAQTAEMPRIAGVLLNRLQQEMPLQVDSAALYAAGYNPQARSWWLHDLDDPQIRLRDSAFNTYVVSGLPAGPIATPGQAAFLAVIRPEQHNYLFFVAKADGSGTHYFAETYAEHLENAAKGQAQTPG